MEKESIQVISTTQAPNPVTVIDEIEMNHSEYITYHTPGDVNTKVIVSRAVAESMGDSYFTIDLSLDPSQVISTCQKSISTLVFFDLESTGLPNFVGKPNVQITELSFIAVNREDFEHSEFPNLKDIRIINKFSLCVKPRVSISFGASKVSGLNDVNLKDQQIFDKDMALMIQIFLSKLSKPTCILAHNGNIFDFPLLKAELERVGVQLSEDLLTVDTLKAFKGLYNQHGGIPGNNSLLINDQQKKPSFSLENLYSRFFAAKHDRSHSAEGDCKALMMICHKIKNHILPWIEANTRQFNSFDTMW